MELAQLGKEPVSDAAPAGTDARMEDAYDALSAEIEKLSSFSVSGGIDWKKVLQLAADISATKSKDLLVFSYLCVALMKTEGLDGLATGVHIMRDLLETFWESMFPAKARMRGRKNAVDWWVERVKAGLGDIGQQTWAAAKRDAFIDDLRTIDEFLGNNMEDAPILSPMISSINGLIEVEKEITAEEGAQPAGDAGQPADSVQKASAASGIEIQTAEGITDREILFKQGLDFLDKYSSMAPEGDSDAVSFRLRRICAWFPVTEVPFHDEGKTLIPPPEGQVVKILEGLCQSGKWEDLLQAAESRISEHLFWLDLHRYAAESLDNTKRADIAEAVAMETHLFVRRLRGIDRLTFADGTPFANEETRQWLKGLTGTADESRKSPAGVEDVNAAVAKAISDSVEKARSGELSAALSSMREKMNRASGLRERFIWEIGFCRFLIQVRQIRIAIPYLNELISFIDQYKVERWEPSLATEALTVVMTGLRLQAEPRDEALMESVLNRMAALNPMAALEFI